MIEAPPSTEDLRVLFADALTSFAAAERGIILQGVSERGLCARLAMRLEPLAHALGLDGYRADVEYNRGRGTDLKLIVGDRWEQIAITCDLILHSRGALDRDNLIAVEMKRRSHDPREKAKDRARLRALTDVERFPRDNGRGGRRHVFGYELGYFVELHRDVFTIEEYVGGRQSDSYHLVAGSDRLQLIKAVEPVLPGLLRNDIRVAAREKGGF